MPMTRTYRCNNCNQTFTFMHHPVSEPAFCPHCGFTEQAAQMNQTLAAPHLGRPEKLGPDHMYRAMEEGAQFRSEKAAEMGVDTAGANDLKITNMKDNLRYGETAHIPVDNIVSRAMQNPMSQGYQTGFGSDGAALSGDVRSGPEPNAGLRASQFVRQNHGRVARESGMATNLNSGSLQSDRPSLEVTNTPGYRR